MTKYVIIVAGGKGLRMGQDIPKQFLPIGMGKTPVLMHTIQAFYAYDSTMKIILVLPEEQQIFWKSLCKEHRFKIKHLIVKGGKTRFHSVKNGLSSIPDNDSVVGVHDGVRPFVSQHVISNCYEVAEQRSAAIPVIDVVETIRKVTASGSHTVSRDNYKIVQTPQVFDTRLLKNAYSQQYNDSFTDDASVVEASGTTVYLVPGNRENIKITTPFDLKIAEVLL